MSINIITSGIHHVALRVANFQLSKKFYIDQLGFQIVLEKPNLFVFMAGNTAIGIVGPDTKTKDGDIFSPFRVGLDHLAMICESETELERVAQALNKEGIQNTGVKLDETLGKRYVAFKDPDKISLEFYMK